MSFIADPPTSKSIAEPEASLRTHSEGEVPAPVPDEALQGRLARKAASARVARAKHKSAVSSLEEQVRELTAKASALEAARLSDAQISSQQLHDELRAALPPHQWHTLSGWLRTAAESAAAESTESEAVESASTSLFAFASNAASTPVQPRFTFCTRATPDVAVAAAAAAATLKPPPSETSPTTVMAEPDDLLACALQGMVGLANCTPRGPRPALADLPPAMELLLPPPAKKSRTDHMPETELQRGRAWLTSLVGHE